MADTQDGMEFKIGLALAGAISAGAYTAGVIDFLIQALEEWEAARGKPGVPEHRTGLKVIAGASAGAITGALGIVALAHGPKPQRLTQQEVDASHRKPGVQYSGLRCMLPTLYATWVEQPRLVASEGGKLDFLSLEDLKPEDGKRSVVGSVLNSRLLDQIKDLALGGQGTRPAAPRPYVASAMHIYMTVSNLRGIPFTVAFGDSEYGMQTHGDRLHYRVEGVGEWDCPDSGWLAADPFLKVEAATLPTFREQKVPKEWDDYGTVALASAAFPIGLGSRTITSPLAQYKGRMYPLDEPPEFIAKPCFPSNADFAGLYTFLNVDGGLINNSPFDYAEYALLGLPSTRRPTPGDQDAAALGTDSALIMVAPFPDPPGFLPEGQPKPELAALVRALLPTLTTQARFRTSELAKAMNPRNHSRYLIAPHRTPPDSDSEARFKIACGALGGFGGFLDEQFRAHDYQLGRRNCQQFLRGTFGLPVGAPAVDAQAAAMHRIAAQKDLPEQVRVIPLVGDAALDVALPRWPRMSEKNLEVLGQRIERRLKDLLPILVDAQTTSKKLRLVGRLSLLLGRRRVLAGIRLAILSDLVRRDQVEGWTLPATLTPIADDARAVLAELASPAFDYRTVAGIAASTHLKPERVRDILGQLRMAAGNLRVATASWSQGLFTLRMRQRDGFWTLPGVALLARWLDPPSSDHGAETAG